MSDLLIAGMLDGLLITNNADHHHPDKYGINDLFAEPGGSNVAAYIGHCDSDEQVILRNSNQCAATLCYWLDDAGPFPALRQAIDVKTRERGFSE